MAFRLPSSDGSLLLDLLDLLYRRVLRDSCKLRLGPIDLPRIDKPSTTRLGDVDGGGCVTAKAQREWQHRGCMRHWRVRGKQSSDDINARYDSGLEKSNR